MSAVNSLQLWDCARRCGYYRSLPQTRGEEQRHLSCLSVSLSLSVQVLSERVERLLTWFNPLGAPLPFPCCELL